MKNTRPIAEECRLASLRQQTTRRTASCGEANDCGRNVSTRLTARIFLSELGFPDESNLCECCIVFDELSSTKILINDEASRLRIFTAESRESGINIIENRLHFNVLINARFVENTSAENTNTANGQSPSLVRHLCAHSMSRFPHLYLCCGNEIAHG